MSATTELLIFQAAPAPTGALALGVPASDAEYEAFSETLKAELNSGQTSAENGKSLPQGGENLPDDEVKAQHIGATVASDWQKTTMPSTDGEPSDAKAVASAASEAGAPTSAGTPGDTSDPVSRTHALAQSALSGADPDQSALGDTALQTLTDAAAERDVMLIKTVAALSTHDTPVQWSPLQISERLDAIGHLLAANGKGALPGILDPDLHQKLAHSQHSLVAIEQRLGQLAEAGVSKFTEALYSDGTRATALTTVASALTADETIASSMADSTITVIGMADAKSPAMNKANVVATVDTASGALTPSQSQRLDAIWNMMASSGQGGIQGTIQGTIAADLHRALADSDDSLDSIRVRLQALSSEGVTHFNKANFFAERSLSDRPAATQGVLGSGVALGRANQAVEGSPVPRADAGAAARAATESVGLSAASVSNTTFAGADQLTGAEVDPRRAAMAFASAQNKQIAGRADAMSADATARATNLTADDLQQALSTPQTRASQVAALEAGGSATADRNTAVTMSPAQMAEQRRADQSAASGSLNGGLSNNSGVTAPEWKVADAGRPVAATSELAGLTADLDGPNSLQPSKAARARMAAAIDSRPAVSSSTAALDPMAMAQGSMQDARLEGRFASDLQGNRSVSFELPQATNTASSTTASTLGGTLIPSGLPASASSASSAAMRAGGEHVMQNAPWAPQFTDEVSEQVRVFVNNGLQEARLQLTPADLGRVQITINTEGDNARVVFVAETAVARDLLDQSMPRLREMLQQSGIQLAQGDVSDQTESQRRGERLSEDAQRMAQGESDAQADDQALRPQLANIDAEEGLGEAGRVDTYI